MTTEEFISIHADDDVRQLALKARPDGDIDLPFALDQIAGRQTARRKLPSWAATEGIIYPPHLSMEQCSGEPAARYKASVAARLTHRAYAAADGHDAATGATDTTGGRLNAREDGQRDNREERDGILVDITGGFGVDFSYMAREFGKAIYVERQEHLCRIAEANFRRLGLTQAVTINGDGPEYIAGMEDHASLIYADPARRDDHGGRTFAISDCTPDILSILGMLLNHAPHVMLKLSPMLDWRKAVRDISETGATVSEVHIVATAGECKELLIVICREPANGLRIFCVNDGTTVEYDADETVPEPSSAAGCPDEDIPAPPCYVYEPNASVMKAGCFGLIASRYGVRQISRDSHLFVSRNAVGDFPGRRFEVTAVTTMNKKELRRTLSGVTKANITVRNFPMNTATLRRRLKLAEGGDTYIMATTTAGGCHILLICNKA